MQAMSSNRICGKKLGIPESEYTCTGTSRLGGCYIVAISNANDNDIRRNNIRFILNHLFVSFFCAVI